MKRRICGLILGAVVLGSSSGVYARVHVTIGIGPLLIGGYPAPAVVYQPPPYYVPPPVVYMGGGSWGGGRGHHPEARGRHGHNR